MKHNYQTKYTNVLQRKNHDTLETALEIDALELLQMQIHVLDGYVKKAVGFTLSFQPGKVERSGFDSRTWHSFLSVHEVTEFPLNLE